MITKIRKNMLLLAIVASLFGLGIKNTVSAVQVADVINTRTETMYAWGGTDTTYTWKTLHYRNGFRYRITGEHRMLGLMVSAWVYTYHYTTY